MSKPLPLLIFPKPKSIKSPKGRGGFSNIHFPDHQEQVKRLTPMIDRLKANVSSTVAGLEPETALIIEIVGSVDKFHQAVEKSGLEWLGEWDLKDIEPDEDFYLVKEDKKAKKEIKTDKKLKRQLFLSFLDQQGKEKLLSLWEKWKTGKKFLKGETKWRDVFNQTYDIRQWGIQESLRDTGMIDRWRDLTDSINEEEPITFQIELFYRKNKEKQKQNERNIKELLKVIGGKKLSSFINMLYIAFHAVKVQLPAKKIKEFLQQIESKNQSQIDIQLFRFPGIMYFRPTGQSISIFEKDITAQRRKFLKGKPTLPPVAGILDGVPRIKHEALIDRILLDDPDNLSSEYQPGERLHGTSMASLVIHGDLSDSNSEPLSSQVYHIPVMQPDPKARSIGNIVEHFPDHVFFEDRIERAVHRVFERAPTVKIINLSICDSEYPFIHTLSPFARLLDYLSFKYKVLFCVSAGNFTDKIDLQIPIKEFQKMSSTKKQKIVLKAFKDQLSGRRLLSPAESLNSLTIGALHSDQSGDYNQGHRIDLLFDGDQFFSPISRFGYGFRRSIKPEILFPGGRQLYTSIHGNTNVSIAGGSHKPGQQTAWDSQQQGDTSKVVFTRGTSNATALATRSGVHIYEKLSALNEKENNPIPENLMAILIKTLLIHSAKHDDFVVKTLIQSLKISGGRKKEILSRYIGYGNANIDRVLNCTEQRGTVIGFGEIEANKAHEYNFPLPIGLSGKDIERRMLVTLAWFSPLNPKHRRLREAKLELKPSENWKNTALKLKRKDSDLYQVLRGSVQHEVFEKDRKKTDSYAEDGKISLQVICKPDATEVLTDKIPYGLAVTLEVEEDIKIYQEIRQKLKQPIPIKPK